MLLQAGKDAVSSVHCKRPSSWLAERLFISIRESKSACPRVGIRLGSNSFTWSE